MELGTITTLVTEDAPYTYEETDKAIEHVNNEDSE